MLFNNKLIILFLSLLITTVMVSSCKSKADSEPIAVEEGPQPFENEEFVSFYNTFSSDSLYQLDHIAFPLEGMRPMADSLDIVPPDFRWTKDTWKIHKAFDDGNKSFVRQIINGPGGVIIENISDVSGQYTMERRFAKLSSGWNLIYYRKMGKY